MIEKRKFYINGTWVDPIVGNNHFVIDTSSEGACAVISLGPVSDTDTVVAAAKAGFPTWAATTVVKRKAFVEEVLLQFERRWHEWRVIGCCARCC